MFVADDTATIPMLTMLGPIIICRDTLCAAAFRAASLTLALVRRQTAELAVLGTRPKPGAGFHSQYWAIDWGTPEPQPQEVDHIAGHITSLRRRFFEHHVRRFLNPECGRPLGQTDVRVNFSIPHGDTIATGQACALTGHWWTWTSGRRCVGAAADCCSAQC